MKFFQFKSKEPSPAPQQNPLNFLAQQDWALINRYDFKHGKLEIDNLDIEEIKILKEALERQSIPVVERGERRAEGKGFERVNNEVRVLYVMPRGQAIFELKYNPLPPNDGPAPAA